MSKPVFTKPEAAAMQAQIAALNALLPTYHELTGDTAEEREEIGDLLWIAVERLRDAAMEGLLRLQQEASNERQIEQDAIEGAGV